MPGQGQGIEFETERRDWHQDLPHMKKTLGDIAGVGLKFCKWCIDFFLVLRALLLLSGSANIRLLFSGDGCLWYEGEREEHLLRGSSVKNHTSWLFVRVEVKAAAWDLKEGEPTG